MATTLLGSAAYGFGAATSYPAYEAAPELPQLDAPTLGPATDVSSSSATLSWSEVLQATKYRLRRGSVVIYEGTARSYMDFALQASATYSYTVQAVGDGVNFRDSDLSVARSVTTAAPPIGQPPAPAGLTVANDGTVTWTLAAGKFATDYEYYVGPTIPNPTWTAAPAMGFQSGAGIGVLVHLRLRANGQTPAGLEDAASSGGVNYAATYIAAVEGTGTALTPAQRDSLYALEASLKDGVYLSNVNRSSGLIKVLYPLLGGTAEAHAVNFVNPNLNRIVWYGSPTHNQNGVQFNGVNQWGDTGFQAELLPVASNHLLYYADQAVSDPNQSGQGVMGIAVDGQIGLWMAYNRGTLSYYLAGGDAAGAVWQQGQALAGALLGTRTSLSNATLYYQGSAVSTSTVQATGSLSTGTLGIGRVNVNGQYSLVPCSLAAAGLGLNAQQAQFYTTTLQQFQAANGRTR